MTARGEAPQEIGSIAQIPLVLGARTVLTRVFGINQGRPDLLIAALFLAVPVAGTGP